MWKRRKIHTIIDSHESFTGCGELVRVCLNQQCGFAPELVQIILGLAGIQDVCEHTKVSSNQLWLEWTTSQNSSNPGEMWRLRFTMQRSCGMFDCRTCTVSAIHGWLQRKSINSSDFDAEQLMLELDQVSMDSDMIRFTSSRNPRNLVKFGHQQQDTVSFQGDYYFTDRQKWVEMDGTLTECSFITACLLVAAEDLHHHRWKHLWISNQ